MKRDRKYISKKLRDRVRAKYSGRCAYCGQTPRAIHVDHIVPVNQGGGDEIENLAPACQSCNGFKHDFTMDQFRRELQEQANKAKRYSTNYRFALRFGLVEETGKRIKFYFEGIDSADRV